jgi:hypothetical protein
MEEGIIVRHAKSAFWPQKSPAIGKIIFVSITVSLTLLAVEMALRAFAPLLLTGGYIGAYKYDPVLGTRLRENLHWFKTTDYQQEIKTNKFGTANFNEAFDSEKGLIFAVGDSYTQGTGLPADASYPFQLDLLLNQSVDGFYKPVYGIVNLGLSAFGAEQELLSLQIYSEKIGRPRYILYLGCDNDLEDDLRFQSGYRHRHLVEGSPHWGRWLFPLQWITQETEIGKRLNLAYSQYRLRTVGEGESGQGRIFASEVSVAEHEEKALNKIEDATRRQGAQLIVSWANTSNSYPWLQQWARRNGAGFADWGSLVESVRVAMPNIPMSNNHSGGHYRTWVNTLIARAFAKEIRRLDAQ